MDSLPDVKMLDKYPEQIREVWPKDKDFTDTELGLRWLERKHVGEIVLVGGSGGRLDHFFALKALFDMENPPVQWITESSIVCCIGDTFPVSSLRISGLTRDDPVSVFPSGKHRHDCRAEGFFWPIEQLTWDEGQYSLSNRCESDSIFIESVQGRFLVVLPLRRGIRIESFNGSF